MTLFEWASSGHERTLNQRCKPGLIIIINNATKISEEWLDVGYATEKLLSAFGLSGNFQELKEKWAKRGRDISTATELIHCYYASFRVIVVPSLPEGLSAIKATRVISEQYKTLYAEICNTAKRQRENKKRAGMQLDVDTFNSYLDHAFRRLTKDLKYSIDFYYLARRDGDAPSRFSEHLTSVVIKMLEIQKYDSSNDTGQEAKLFSE